MEGKESTRMEESPTSDEHPRGYTLADEELERLREKRQSGDVLDPLALDDPTGSSVERVVLRVGISVIIILVVGILLAQVACKNIRLSLVPDLSSGVTESSVDSALSNGILWGSEIVTFPSGSEVTLLDETAGVLEVTMTDESSRSIEQLTSSAQTRALALAMNAFDDENIQTVTVVVMARVSSETGLFTGSASDPLGVALEITWTRDGESATTFSSTITGFELASASKSAAEDKASAA